MSTVERIALFMSLNHSPTFWGIQQSWFYMLLYSRSLFLICPASTSRCWLAWWRPANVLQALPNLMLISLLHALSLRRRLPRQMNSSTYSRAPTYSDECSRCWMYTHHAGFEGVDVWTFLLGETVCSLLQVCMIFGENGKVISIINIFKLGEEIPLDASGFDGGGILHGPVSGSGLCNYLGFGHLSFLNVKAFIFVSLSPSHRQTWGPLYFYKFYLICLSSFSFSDSSSFFLSKGFHLLASWSTSVQNTILPVLHFSFMIFLSIHFTFWGF